MKHDHEGEVEHTHEFKMPESIKNTVARVKQHVKDNKTKYLIGGTAVSCLAIGGTAGKFFASCEVKQTVDSLKLVHIQYKSPNVNVALVKEAMPDPIPVRYKPTGEDFRSMRRAAKMLGMNAANISADAHGEQKLFELLPESVFA